MQKTIPRAIDAAIAAIRSGCSCTSNFQAIDELRGAITKEDVAYFKKCMDSVRNDDAIDILTRFQFVQSCAFALNNLTLFNDYLLSEFQDAIQRGDDYFVWRICIFAMNSHTYKPLSYQQSDFQIAHTRIRWRTEAYFNKACSAFPPPKNTSKKILSRCDRLVVLVEHLRATKIDIHAYQISLYISAFLKRRPNGEVLLLITEEFGHAEPNMQFRFLSDGHDNLIRQYYRERLDRSVLERTRFYVGGASSENTPIQQNLLTATNTIAQFQPDIVVNWGGGFESLLIRDWVQKYYPSAILQSGLASRETKGYDLYLAQGRQGDFSHRERPECWRSHAVPVVPYPKGDPYPEDEIRNNSDSVLGVLALSNGRLEQTIASYSDEYLAKFLNIFERHPEFSFLCIGVEEPTLISERHSKLDTLMTNHRLRTRPLDPNLRAALAHTDIYLQLPGVRGGGMGAALAVAEGVPVLSHWQCDSVNYLPNVYLVERDDEYLEQLEAMIVDSRLRQTIAKAQEEKIESVHSIEAIGKQFCAYLDEAIQLHAKREEQP